MKIYLIILLASLTACSSINTSNRIAKNKIPKYKALEKYKGDTLAFVQQSILNRKQYYIGKELGVLLKDLSIPISVYSFSNIPNDINSSNHIILNINNYFVQRNKLEKQEDPITLAIKWDKNIDYNEFDAISRKNKYQWLQRCSESIQILMGGSRTT